MKIFSENTSYTYQRYIYASGNRFKKSQTKVLYNTDDHTYSIDISVRDGRNYWFHSDKREVELRQYVQALFSPGGDLYAYRAENDLYSDYEKYTAVWNWIKITFHTAAPIPHGRVSFGAEPSATAIPPQTLCYAHMQGWIPFLSSERYRRGRTRGTG